MLLIASGFFACILEDGAEADEIWPVMGSAGFVDACWWFCVETSSSWGRLAISYGKAARQLLDGGVKGPRTGWRIVAGSSQELSSAPKCRTSDKSEYLHRLCVARRGR